MKNQRTKKVETALKENPSLSNEDFLKEAAEDADRYHALKRVLDSEGGELLCESLIADAMRCFDAMAANHRTLNHAEFISLSAQAQSALTLARALTRAAENLKAADEALSDALRE